ncbi:MAG: hypothetical protein ACRCX2_19905 [Paraclostridium sp.]
MKVVSTEALTRALGLIKTELGKKEPSITKKTGFNLDKTDTVQNNPSILFTTKGAFDLKTELVNSINTKMDKSGGTFTGSIRFDSASEKRIQGTNNVGLYFDNLSGGTIGIYDWIKNKGVLSYNTTSQELGFGVPLRASSFIGALTGKSTTSGTADAAVKLQTARNITINGSSLSFDGTGNLIYEPLDIGLLETRVLGNTTLTGESPNAGGTNTFDIIVPLPSTSSTAQFGFKLSLSGHWSHTNICGTDTFEISCLPSNSGGFSSFKVIPVSNSTQGKYFLFKDPVRTSEGVKISVFYTGNNNTIYVSTNFIFGDKTIYKNIRVSEAYRSNREGVRLDVYTTTNKPTLQEIGAFPSSGGTISGALQVGGNTGVTGNLTVSGTINGSKTYNAVWNDYAEYFPKKIGYKTEPGDIIALSKNDTTEKYELATNDHVLAIGVHSDQYGHLIGGEKPPEDSDISFEEWNKDKYIPVGLAGRVPVKFIGIARKGMKVVPSDIPGVGKEYGANDRYDNIIGYIVEDNDEEGIRRVKIKIGK